MTEKKSFLMYTSYLDNVAFLSDEEAGQLLKAIYAFVNGDEVPELERVVQVTFNPIKSHLERDRVKYENICKNNRKNAKKRWNEKIMRAYAVACEWMRLMPIMIMKTKMLMLMIMSMTMEMIMSMKMTMK